jgi:hypothetical protein
MSSALDLVVLNGPREGEVVQLDPSRSLHLGRSVKGYQLVDPLVSLNHAELQWEGDCYWLEDLGSATGTFVNDVRVDKPVMVMAGMRVRLGETVIEVRNRPRATLYRAAAVVGIVLVFVLAVAQYRRSIVVEYDPKVEWYQPVKQGVLGASAVVTLPNAFIRTTGVDHRGITIDRVTDYDADGVDELWLSWKGGRQVVTFGMDGEWRVVGDLQPECREKARTLDESLPAECYVAQASIKSELPEACKRYGQVSGFPDLDCSGVTYRMVDNKYQIAGMEGVVAWMDPTELVKNEEASKKAKKDVFDVKVLDGAPVPYLFTLTKIPQLAGFLADRGVHEPIHYLVCEEAIPGMKPQVLTESGRIIQLGVGCLGEVDLIGPSRTSEFASLRPRMLAFTGIGAQQLVKDLAIYLSGGEDPAVMDKPSLKAFDNLRKAPVRKQGGIRVFFNGPEQIGNPVAADKPVEVRDRLVPTEFAPPRPERAWSVTLLTAGRYDVEGCSELDIRVTDWHCVFAKGCGEGDPFLQIRNTGCGPGRPVIIPFKPGEHRYSDGVLKGKVVVEAEDNGRQIDVLRVRLTYGLSGAGDPTDPAEAPAGG